MTKFEHAMFMYAMFAWAGFGVYLFKRSRGWDGWTFVVVLLAVESVMATLYQFGRLIKGV